MLYSVAVSLSAAVCWLKLRTQSTPSWCAAKTSSILAETVAIKAEAIAKRPAAANFFQTRKLGSTATVHGHEDLQRTFELKYGVPDEYNYY